MACEYLNELLLERKTFLKKYQETQSGDFGCGCGCGCFPF